MSVVQLRELVASAQRLELPAEPEGVTLVRANEITVEPVRWLWNGWLPAGKLAILAGAPGCGKTTIALAAIATVTTGGRWPDGTRAAIGEALIWTGEDDPADTLVPRLLAMGAELSRVSFITGATEIVDGVPQQVAFDPARHMEALLTRIAKQPPALLVVDPIVSAVAGDSHKNAETRRGLQPLVDLARTLSVATLGITHFSKGSAGRDPTERVTGSLAFGALARVVLVAAKQADDDKASRMLMRSKSNIGADTGGFGYDIEQREVSGHPGLFASVVMWGEAIDGSARDVLASAEAPSATDDDDDSPALDEAVRFLRDALANGEVPAKQVRAAAMDACVSWMTVRRAKGKLGIKPRKSGMDGGWYWSLPVEGDQDAHLKNDEHLRRSSNTFEDAHEKRGGDTMNTLDAEDVL